MNTFITSQFSYYPLPSCSAKISFINTLIIPGTTFHFTAKISLALCCQTKVQTRDTKSFHSLLTRQTLQAIRKILPGRLSPQPQQCGARLVTVTNEAVPRSSTTSFVFSQIKHFLFSTSWKYQRVPIWLKTLNPKGYAEKCWY